MDRRDRKMGARDTRRLLRSAASGKALAFFPEGTFGPEVGLLKFHIGAFAAAARAHLPVVPVVIRGTRRSLPAESPWPNPGRIQVEILAVVPAIAPNTATEEGDVAARLRDAARSRILSVLNEPDLASGQTQSFAVRERYERELAARHYVPDPAQSAVVDRLDALRTRLLAENEPGLLARWLQRFRLDTTTRATPGESTCGEASAAAKPGWWTCLMPASRYEPDAAVISTISCATFTRSCAHCGAAPIRSNWQLAAWPAARGCCVWMSYMSATSPTPCCWEDCSRRCCVMA